MKYQLETIPVWEAYEEQTECPLCFLEFKMEKSNVQFFLGSSVMEPDIREKVNELGFCPVHFKMLFSAGNKLSLALMTHTHLRSLIKKIKKYEKKPAHKTCNEYIRSQKTKSNECVLCRKLEKTLKRYTFTICHLWKKDDDFKKTFNASKGFCLPHYAGCLNMAEEVFSSQKKDIFLKELYELEMRNLLRLEDEIHWFTKKFDYKNRDKSWKTSKDALARTIQKLTGKIPG